MNTVYYEYWELNDKYSQINPIVNMTQFLKKHHNNIDE